MADARFTHLLLDFFGTIVDYSPSRTEQGYHRSHELIINMGCDLGYTEFLQQWSAVSSRFDQRSVADDSEFSMVDVASAFLSGALGRPATAHETAALIDSYLAEWNAGVAYPTGMAEVIRRLATTLRLAVVTNTHDRALVPNHLRDMGIAAHIDEVVTSVEVGWRKPHKAIYAAALERLGISAEQALFVGDTFAADYVGPRAMGIEAFLIDPRRDHDVALGRRLGSLADLPGRLEVGWIEDLAFGAEGRLLG